MSCKQQKKFVLPTWCQPLVNTILISQFRGNVSSFNFLANVLIVWAFIKTKFLTEHLMKLNFIHIFCLFKKLQSLALSIDIPLIRQKLRCRSYISTLKGCRTHFHLQSVILNFSAASEMGALLALNIHIKYQYLKTTLFLEKRAVFIIWTPSALFCKLHKKAKPKRPTFNDN